MTTTLRPTEPLQHHEDGTRSRRYQVCVNGRPVGAVRLGTHPVLGDTVARMSELRIEEPDRRRGRGTVAALAAEEVARGLGCRSIEVTVPGAAKPALRLATALGYVVRERGMEKALGGTPPALPTGSRARPMTEAEYAPWLQRAHEGRIRGWAGCGLPEAEARSRSERYLATLLPDGPRTPEAFLGVLEHEETPVGTLWVASRDGRAHVFDAETDAARRGSGHGRTLMLLAEAQAITAGHRVIGLDVPTGNTPAEHLSESLGYGTTQYTVYKTLL